MRDRRSQAGMELEKERIGRQPRSVHVALVWFPSETVSIRSCHKYAKSGGMHLKLRLLPLDSKLTLADAHVVSLWRFDRKRSRQRKQRQQISKLDRWEM